MGGINKEILMSNDTQTILGYLSKVDILVADEKGYIIQINDNFEEYYGCSGDYVIGKSVLELEKEGLFTPSSIAKVLETGQESTLVQMVNNNRRLIVTAVPIKDRNNKIIRVVAYSTDIEEYFNLKECSEELYDQIDSYNMRIRELEEKQRLMEELLNKNPMFDFNDNLKSIKKSKCSLDDIITQNKEFKMIIRSLEKISKYDVNILLLGETGVGKSMIAKKIHMLSNYSEGEFVEVNCGAMPEHLIETELFGYTKGSFTGANNEGKKGLIELANKGTIFLDEVGELPLQAQVKLLKVIQDKLVRRVGGTTSKPIDCRIIAATNKNLEEEVKKSNFRSDLMYRLNTITINIPSLKNREEDIVLLSQFILDKYNKKYKENKVLEKSVIETLEKYSWPGNIRELENVIQKLIVISDGNVITKDSLPDYILNNKIEKDINLDENNYTNINDLNEFIEEHESKIIKAYFEKYKSSIKVAKALNISQTTASRKIRKYIID